MPDIDLRPDDYRKQNRWGGWYLPDDPKTLVIGIVVVAVMAAYVFFVRDQLSGNILLAAGAFLGALFGVFITLLMKALNVN